MAMLEKAGLSPEQPSASRFVHVLYACVYKTWFYWRWHAHSRAASSMQRLLSRGCSGRKFFALRHGLALTSVLAECEQSRLAHSRATHGIRDDKFSWRSPVDEHCWGPGPLEALGWSAYPAGKGDAHLVTLIAIPHRSQLHIPFLTWKTISNTESKPKGDYLDVSGQRR